MESRHLFFVYKVDYIITLRL